MIRPAKIISISLIWLFMAASSRADIIFLRNVRSIEGKITDTTIDYIEIKLGSGKMRTGTKDVSSFEAREPAEGYSTAALPEINTEPEPEPKTEEAPQVFSASIKVKAEYKRGKIYVSGTSELANNTPLRVYFMQAGGVINMKESRVKRGEFYVVFGPFENRMISGVYTVQAEAMTGTNNRLYSKPYELMIGSRERAETDETKTREYLNRTASGAEALYKELNAEYEKSRSSYSAQKWEDWSGRWFSKVSAARQKFEEEAKAYVVSTHALSQRRIRFCFNQLPLLLRAYTIKLNSLDSKPAKTGFPVQDVALLKRSFEQALEETKQDVSAVAADLKNRQ
jgi:hypothetical protein